jgi:hypothetical protein
MDTWHEWQLLNYICLTEIYGLNRKGRADFEELSLYERIRLKWVSENIFRWYAMVLYFTGYGEWQTFMNTLLKLIGP